MDSLAQGHRARSWVSNSVTEWERVIQSGPVTYLKNSNKTLDGTDQNPSPSRTQVKNTGIDHCAFRPRMERTTITLSSRFWKFVLELTLTSSSSWMKKMLVDQS